MPTARPVPPLDADRATTLFGPFAAPFALGYAFFRMGSELSMVWVDTLFEAHRPCEEEDDEDLPVPDMLEAERHEPELFA